MKLLVVGADSLIGNALMGAARALAWQVTGTTRRPGVTDLLALDLIDPAPATVLRQAFDAVVLCAAVSRFDQCTADPRTAHLVNVEAPVRIGMEAAERGAHVVFLSTDSVFGESNCLRREHDPVTPGARTYPAQKARAEDLLMQALPAEQLAIVRLTKVVSARREPFSTWCSALRGGGHIEGLSDLLISPVSVRHVSQALVQVCAGRHAGILHLSGERDLSYAEFAWEVSARGGGAAVTARSLAQAGVQPSYRPRHCCLDMTQTTRSTGLRPQPATVVAEDLLAEAQMLQRPAERDAAHDLTTKAGTPA